MNRVWASVRWYHIFRGMEAKKTHEILLNADERSVFMEYFSP